MSQNEVSVLFYESSLAREDTFVMLPDIETLKKRLNVVSDDPHIREFFYPELTKYAGDSYDIVDILGDAIESYTAIHTTGGYFGAKGLPFLLMEEYVDALIIDNNPLAERVKRHLNEMLVM